MSVMVRVGIAVALVSAVATSPVAAQPPTQTTPPPGTSAPLREPLLPGTVPVPDLPGAIGPPRTGFEMFDIPPAQGPLILVPSITISEEYNDNVFLNNSDRRSDFITQFTPRLSLLAQQPGFWLIAGYSLTAEIYAKEEALSNAANRHRLLASLYYQVTPRVTWTLTDSFSYDRNTNAVSIAGVSSGRREGWSNTLDTAVDFQVTPRTTWRLSGGYTLERFQGADSDDSNIYRIGTGVDFAATQRLTLTGAYDFAYLDIENAPTAFTHTARFGGRYQITPTLTAGISAGPTFLVADRETTVTPSVRATISKLASWGTISAFYDRGIGTTGAFGGPSDNQTFGGDVAVTTLQRGLVIGFSPRYTMSRTEDVARTRSDINSLTLNLLARYQIARYVAIVGAYTFYQQRTETSNSRAVDVDQNRVSIGLQFGYPISFD